MAIKVGISFKESEKDIYNFLQKQLSPSIYIKELIKKEKEAAEIKTEENPKRRGSNPFSI
ncbi:MAG: hypothetical protein DBY38_08635 [Clostridium cadaveris]|uniref:Uncharacterized protein n=1 Tax=Clostridium cadaveris TaxID=1529 RepID=A0A316M3L6_9CLOT|nr:MAG: hypothetical protein DBY38_08635 [Clostridium cadaveris]